MSSRTLGVLRVVRSVKPVKSTCRKLFPGKYLLVEFVPRVVRVLSDSRTAGCGLVFVIWMSSSQARSRVILASTDPMFADELSSDHDRQGCRWICCSRIRRADVILSGFGVSGRRRSRRVWVVLQMDQSLWCRSCRPWTDRFKRGVELRFRVGVAAPQGGHRGYQYLSGNDTANRVNVVGARLFPHLDIGCIGSIIVACIRVIERETRGRGRYRLPFAGIGQAAQDRHTACCRDGPSLRPPSTPREMSGGISLKH